MPKYKKEITAETPEIRRLVHKAQKRAGDFEDKADVEVLNQLSRLEYLKGTNEKGASNLLLELSRLEAENKKLHQDNALLKGKLKRINAMTSGWDESGGF